MSARAGFTLVELLVATTIVLLLTSGILALVGPAGSRARAAAIDIQQRMRAGTEAIGADLSAAGAGPINGVFAQSFGATAASLLPYRIGPRGDPDGTSRPDALTLLTTHGVPASACLAAAWAPGVGPASIALGPGCPAGASCGFQVDDVVLVLDGMGQADLFRVDGVVGTSLSLMARGRTSGRAFPAGSPVVPVRVTTYYLKPGTSASDAGQLMAGDGDQSDLPLVDHVTRLSFELFGEPRPPVLRSGLSPPRASYGPSPPLPGVDDPRDGWPAGENCTFEAPVAGQVSRLPALGAGTGLVPLPASVLTDGPWCPDALAPGRYDADLFRVRAVRVTLGLQAMGREARGGDSRLFVNPGASRDPSSPAADRQVVFDVVPRMLQRGR